MPKNNNGKNKEVKETTWFKDFKKELKKIIWPKGRELLDNIIVVFSMVIIVSLTIVVLDLAFDALTGVEVKAVKKLQEKTGKNNTEVTKVLDENSQNEEHKDEKAEENNEEKKEDNKEENSTDIEVKQADNNAKEEQHEDKKN